MPLMFIPVILGFGLLSCKSEEQSAASENHLEELSKLQLQERKAHLEEQPALLVNMLADTFIQAKNGVVQQFTKDQMTQRFIDYFDEVEFIKWDDTAPPVYSVSADGMMASILIQKEVIVSLADQPDASRDTTHFAWTELWRKDSGRWKLHQVTTTDDAK